MLFVWRFHSLDKDIAMAISILYMYIIYVCNVYEFIPHQHSLNITFKFNDLTKSSPRLKKVSVNSGPSRAGSGSTFLGITNCTLRKRRKTDIERMRDKEE